MKSRLTFRWKLCLYFAGFTVIIFSVLWILLTVFLQSFYNNMLVENTRAAAQKIVSGSGDGEVIDDLARNRSLLICLTAKDGNLLYSADEYKEPYRRRGGPVTAGENPYRQPDEPNWQKAGYRDLPEGYDEFLAALADSPNGVTELRTESVYIYGTYVGENVLYISTALDPVGKTAGIIRILLMFVTLAALLVAFGLAWVLSRRFSRPVADISSRAAKLGAEDYPDDPRRGFCSELDELGDTLDITNSKLREAQKFQRELLANVSHDLRTPLTMIKGYAESIRDFGSDEGQRGDAEIIIRESDRLTALVNEILEYSELQAEGASAELCEVDISRLVNKAADQFQPLFSRDGGIIRRDIEEHLIVLGDASQLERVIYNLVDNAIRHSGSSKEISVSLKRRGGVIRLEVSDYGEGIPPEQLRHIWDRYFTSRQRGGKCASGLGLAIVKQIVLLHKGNCGADSAENGKTTFWVELNSLL